MQDDDEQIVTAPKKPVSPYAEYDEEFEDDTS